MSEKENVTAKKIKDVMRILPADKREYLIGYADGVIAARASSMEQPRQTASGGAG